MNGPRRPPGGAARRPNIGITLDLEAAPSPSALPRYELKVAYADAVLRAGGLPLALPYSEDPAVQESFLDRISGLVVTGGAFDIPPELYGEPAREGLGALKPSRTTFELGMLRGALKRNLPVLGICGGMQLLHVALGGTLFQDLGRECPGAKEHEQKHDRCQPHHPVEVKDGTLLAELLGRGQLMVNSTHHQAARAPGPHVTVSAVAPDGVVEAIECAQYRFALGVQWHPENLVQSIPAHLGVYRGLVQRAREWRR